MFTLQIFRRFALLAATAFLVGCSSNVPSVEGVVLVDGKPTPGVSILFYPEQPSEGAGYGMALTDDAGKFLLMNKSAETQMAGGAYRVTCSRFVDKKGATVPPDVKAEEVGGRQTIATKYQSLRETPLRVVLPTTSPTDLEFRVVSN